MLRYFINIYNSNYMGRLVAILYMIISEHSELSNQCDRNCNKLLSFSDFYKLEHRKDVLPVACHMPGAVMIYSSWDNTAGVPVECASVHLAKLTLVTCCFLRHSFLLHPRKQKVKLADWISVKRSPSSLGIYSQTGSLS